MADGSWRSVDAQCPFYVRDGRCTITCEGITEGEEMKRRLADETVCTETFRTFCAAQYAECPVYKFVMRVKYGEFD